VIRADVGLTEPKLFVVVSNNQRNRNFDQVLVARLTTSPKRDRPSVVELHHDHAGFTGRVVCDDIETIWEDEVVEVLGGLEPATMREINRGLAAAFALD
jgi:mRNA interferase MazF